MPQHRDLRALVVLELVEMAIAVLALVLAHRCASELLGEGLALVALAYLALALRTAGGIAGLRSIGPARPAPIAVPVQSHPYRSAPQRWN